MQPEQRHPDRLPRVFFNQENRLQESANMEELQYPDYMAWIDPAVQQFPRRHDMVSLGQAVKDWAWLFHNTIVVAATTRNAYVTQQHAIELSYRETHCELILRKILGIETIVGTKAITGPESQLVGFISLATPKWRGWPVKTKNSLLDVIYAARNLAYVIPLTADPTDERIWGAIAAGEKLLADSGNDLLVAARLLHEKKPNITRDALAKKLRIRVKTASDLLVVIRGAQAKIPDKGELVRSRSFP